VAFGDVLLLAVPYRAFPELSKEVGPAMKGKIVIDASNPIVARDGEVAAEAREKGAGLAAAQYFPGARIVRAFNAIGYAKLPEFAGRPGTGMPMAADDQKAYAVAAELVREVGLEPVLVGPLAMGKHLVPGTPLGGEHTPDEIRKIAATLK
jgi:predicted dinucleotide-binding enzyme